ncbi:MAG: Tab2/Atab2 family RNA-binding protein [Cyanobacteria bacterium SID2]|nr:Tab2/Atab2 family RNA-binding protein [Cyanobacteria bacterium SID2]MBP0004386.1 Tab2/Atab2 family RNA-binding protein [Cyanobacteria bacterium SBC]
MFWQVDFFRRPVCNESGEVLWELLACDRALTFQFQAWCPQSQANADWIAAQLQQASPSLPEGLQVFRPESLSLIEAAGQQLGVAVEATRRVEPLKRWLLKRVESYRQHPGYTGDAYDPLAVPRPAPIPVPDRLWGDRWRFASLPAGEIEDFATRPMRFRSIPEPLRPLHLALASTQAVPGVVIDGGRQSLPLARWLESLNPVAINFIPGAPNGLILEAGLADRWVLATFDDPEVQAAAQVYRQRQQQSKGLHFLLVQPDDAGVTHTGFWLLQLA